MSAQDPGGAVQSAGEFYLQLHSPDVAIPLIRERDASMRRAAIEECAALLDARGVQHWTDKRLLHLDDASKMLRALLAAPGPPSERGEP